ncbi:MAG: hypothetical protein GYA57_20475 [Myxococcales bacterium]|nr:hypothetical protein [Myxococcales bacterium]
MPGPVTLVVEGTVDAAVAERLLAEAGWSSGPKHVKQGKAALDRCLDGYANAARFSCWLVLRDLDHDAGCAPELRRKLLRRSSAHFRLHVAVRAVESWLLADADAFGRFFGVAPERIPSRPDGLPSPKRTLVELARRSRRREVREAIVPAADSGAQVGPGYTVFVTEFASRHWRPGAAARRSPSLERLRVFLRRVSGR